MHQSLNLKRSSAFLKQAAVITFVALSSASTFALPSDRNQQISLVADRATYNENWFDDLHR